LHQLGTFGGNKRGVLWVYPDSGTSSSSSSIRSISSSNSNHNNEKTEPLIELQARLQEQFPMCTEQRKVDGVFRPHMTLSHFVNVQTAQEAQQQVEAWWPATIHDDIALTNNDDNHTGSDAALLEFWVDRIYLLHRKGDNGQFCIVAEIPLLGGHDDDAPTRASQPKKTDGDVASISSIASLQVYHPPRPFLEFMPETECDWVRQARLELKSRRNRRSSSSYGRARGEKALRGGGGGRQERSRPSSRSPDSPEVIAAKQAARKAKREKKEQAAAAAASASEVVSQVDKNKDECRE
jgi:2'-5' RNA ligase superfamily